MNGITDQLINVNSLLRLAIQKLESNRVLINEITVRNKRLIETYKPITLDKLTSVQKVDCDQQVINDDAIAFTLPEFKPLEYTVYEFKPLPKRDNRQRDKALKLIDDNIAKLQTMRNKNELRGDPTFNSVFYKFDNLRHNYSVLLCHQNNVRNSATDLFKIKYRGKHRPCIWSE